MRENVDQNNSEYGRFSRSDCFNLNDMKDISSSFSAKTLPGKGYWPALLGNLSTKTWLIILRDF